MTRDKTIEQWIMTYVQKNGELPTKPLYLDYRCLPSVRKELVMTFDEDERVWSDPYDKEKHGDITEENFHIFIPYIN